MTSVIRTLLGLSVLAVAVGSAGCSSSGTTNGAAGGPTIVGTGGSTGTGGSSGSDLPSGIPLMPSMGWVDGTTNSAMIQGALFTYADPTTMVSLTDTIKTGPGNCMQGTAAKVVMPCTIVPPATDCYGTTWGAAMGLNLNQPNVTNDAGVSMGGTAIAFNATAAGITGFAFDISGGDGSATNGVPTPANFRFLINDTATNQYCTTTAKGVKPGANVYHLSDLIEECWQTAKATDLTGDTAASDIVKIAWQVVTNANNTVPFNFCVSNIEALTN